MLKTRASLQKLDGNTQPETEIEKAADEVGETAYEPKYLFNGTFYPSYEELVKAKRKRNAEVLAKSGLLEASVALSDAVKKKPTTRGIRPDKRISSEENTPTIRRSSRIAGIQSDGIYIEEERSGLNISIGKNGSILDGTLENLANQNFPIREKYFKNRVNDGSDLSLASAIELCDAKWKSKSHTVSVNSFFNSLNGLSRSCALKSTKSKTMKERMQALSVKDEKCVSKVVPNRIYSVALHPSPHKLIAVGGDKQGYIGFWDVDHRCLIDDVSSSADGVHLLKLYNCPVSNLEWDKEGRKLLSSSYDGSTRLFDIEKEVFSEIFATYDDSYMYNNKLGYGLDMGYPFWVQFVTFDPRHEKCIFASTSLGQVIHVDLRNNGHISFNQQLSEKKINTVRYAANDWSDLQ